MNWFPKWCSGHGSTWVRSSYHPPWTGRPEAGLTARLYFTRRYDMMHQLQALASYCEERWAVKIGQGQGFRIRIGTQEQQAPSGRRSDRLNADNRRQAAHRLAESAAPRSITSKGGGGGERGLFASDYVPVQGGQLSTRLPFAVLQPKRREVPQQPVVLRYPEHDWPVCALCRERRRGVRSCRKRGHRTAGY